MPLYDCKDREIKLLQRLRALTDAGIGQVRLELRPLAIIEKIDTRLEVIERPLALPPAATAVDRKTNQD